MPRFAGCEAGHSRLRWRHSTYSSSPSAFSTSSTLSISAVPSAPSSSSSMAFSSSSSPSTCAPEAFFFLPRLEIAQPDTDLFVITEKGYGKRTPIAEYPEHHRGGQGVFTITMTEKKGLLAVMKIVAEDDEIMIMSEEGVCVRTPVLRARGRGCPRAAGADHLSNSGATRAPQRSRPPVTSMMIWPVS